MSTDSVWITALIVLGILVLAAAALVATAQGWIAFSMSLRIVPKAKRDGQVKAVQVVIPAAIEQAPASTAAPITAARKGAA